MTTDLFRWIGIAVAVVAVAITLWIFSYIEDWSRDLSTNVAETSPAAKDQRLRTWTSSATPDALENSLRRLPSELSLWSFIDSSTIDPSTRKIHLVHTTALLRFSDDIYVTLTTTAEGTMVNATSRSRIGKGDLGQNPRNLRELLHWLKNAKQ